MDSKSSRLISLGGNHFEEVTPIADNGSDHRWKKKEEKRKKNRSFQTFYREFERAFLSLSSFFQRISKKREKETKNLICILARDRKFPS